MFVFYSKKKHFVLARGNFVNSFTLKTNLFRLKSIFALKIVSPAFTQSDVYRDKRDIKHFFFWRRLTKPKTFTLRSLKSYKCTIGEGYELFLFYNNSCEIRRWTSYRAYFSENVTLQPSIFINFMIFIRFPSIQERSVVLVSSALLYLKAFVVQIEIIVTLKFIQT